MFVTDTVTMGFDALEFRMDEWEQMEASLVGWVETEEGQAKMAWVKTQWENPEVAKMAMRTLYWETEPRYRTLMGYHYEELEKMNGKGLWLTELKIQCQNYSKYLRLHMIAMKTLGFHMAEYSQRFHGDWHAWITQ